MASRRNRPISLPAPYLKRIWLEPSRIANREAYPFCLPLLHDDFELSFDQARSRSSSARTGPANRRCWKGSLCWPDSTKLAAQRVISRSTIRTRAKQWADSFRRRFAQAGYRKSPVVAGSSGPRASFRLRDIWTRPSSPYADFLSHSHGEGFLRFFEERCQRQGVFIFDEPESALSPARQIEFLKLMRRMENIGHCQIIMATHSPMLMAYPNATLLRLTKYGLEPVTVKDTDHYKVMREFCEDPKGFVDAAIVE